MSAKFLLTVLMCTTLFGSSLIFAASAIDGRISIAEQSSAPDYSIELFVNEPWLTAIRDGKKKVEGRAGRLEDFSNWIGKRARFYSSKQEVIVNITDVHHYNSLKDFLRMEGWKNAAPHLSSEEETTNAYLQFYPGDHISKAGGMNGIMISFVRATPIFDVKPKS